MSWISKPPRFTYWAGSGRVFSGFGIWPKYGAGIGKMINILTGSGIWLFPGKQDSPKIGQGMRDLCLRVCRECRKPLKTRVNSKYQSKGSTYILHLLAFVEIRLFNVFFWERKTVFGKLMKKVGDAGSGPPLPDPGWEGSHLPVSILLLYLRFFSVVVTVSIHLYVTSCHFMIFHLCSCCCFKAQLLVEVLS